MNGMRDLQVIAWDISDYLFGDKKSGLGCHRSLNSSEPLINPTVACKTGEKTFLNVSR